MITKIISGGQSGADRGGLDAAIHCALPHGGWCPKGRKAEDGIIPAEYHFRAPLKTFGFSKIFAAAGVGISRRHLASMLSGYLRAYFWLSLVFFPLP